MLAKLLLAILFILSLSSCDKNQSVPSDEVLENIVRRKFLYDTISYKYNLTRIQRGEHLISLGGSVPEGTKMFPVRVYYNTTSLRDGYDTPHVKEINVYRNQFGEWVVDE